MRNTDFGLPFDESSHILMRKQEGKTYREPRMMGVVFCLPFDESWHILTQKKKTYREPRMRGTDFLLPFCPRTLWMSRPPGICAMLWCERHDSVTWLFYICDMNLSYLAHEHFGRVIYQEYARCCSVRDWTLSDVWHESFTHMWHESFTHMWHESFTCCPRTLWMNRLPEICTMLQCERHNAVTWIIHTYVTWIFHILPTNTLDESSIRNMHDAAVWETWRSHMNHSHVWRQSITYCPRTLWMSRPPVICTMLQCERHDAVTWIIHICDMNLFCPQILWMSHPPDICTMLQCERHDAFSYGVATISRLLKSTGLFCKRAPYKRRYSAKETYNFKAPTHRSHPIWNMNLSYFAHEHSNEHLTSIFRVTHAL